LSGTEFNLNTGDWIVQQEFKEWYVLDDVKFDKRFHEAQ
jgi:hypothetical protein